MPAVFALPRFPLLQTDLYTKVLLGPLCSDSQQGSNDTHHSPGQTLQEKLNQLINPCALRTCFTQQKFVETAMS